MTGTHDATRPGLTVAKVLAPCPPEDHQALLVYLERNAKISRDTQVLEAIRDYRLMQARKPHLRVISSEPSID
jgi:hypothetical protein